MKKLLLLWLSASLLQASDLYAQVNFVVQTGGSNPLDGFGTTYSPTPNGNFLPGDFNGDGLTDVAVRSTSNTGVDMWRNNGNGTFTQLVGAANPFAGISFAASVANFLSANTMAGDWDGDGDIDIYNKALNQFYRNDGAAFSVQTGGSNPLDGFGTTYSPTPNGNFLPGDFNGDGLTDVAVRSTSNTGVDMWRNNGNGTFTQLVGAANPFAGISFAASVANFLSANTMAGDWDGDGDIDIYNKALNQFYRNDGAAFSVQTGGSNPLDGFGTTYSPTPNGNFLPGDFNGDGLTDVAVRSTSNTGVDMWRNNGNGTFTQLVGAANPFAGISFAASVANFLSANTMAGDWDGDGDIDIYNKARNEMYAASGSAPRFLSGTPAHNTAAVNRDANIVLNFSEPITTGPGLVYIRRAADNSVFESFAANSANVTGTGTTTITINPTANLEALTGYYLTFDRNALMNASGLIVGRVNTRTQTRAPYTDNSFLSFTTSTTLPVSLVDFAARQQQNGTVKISWQTASEQNNSHFLVQRSADGKTFTTIGQVSGRGTFTGRSAYSFVDGQPLAGTAYYRLLQVDVDGRSKTGPVATVTGRSLGTLRAYPNPVEGSSVTVYLPAGITTPVLFTLTNMAGKVVQGGTISNREQTLHLGTVASGNYILSLSTGEQVKIIKK